MNRLSRSAALKIAAVLSFLVSAFKDLSGFGNPKGLLCLKAKLVRQA